MSIVSGALAASFAAVQLLHGETITLHDRDGVISTEITDAVVTVIPPVGVGMDEETAEYSGVLRLSAIHRTTALECNTVTVRGQVWHILSVGLVFGGFFRCEIGLEDQQHSNRFDLSGNQAVFHGA